MLVWNEATAASSGLATRDGTVTSSAGVRRRRLGGTASARTPPPRVAHRPWSGQTPDPTIGPSAEDFSSRPARISPPGTGKKLGGHKHPPAMAPPNTRRRDDPRRRRRPAMTTPPPCATTPAKRPRTLQHERDGCPRSSRVSARNPDYRAVHRAIATPARRHPERRPPPPRASRAPDADEWGKRWPPTPATPGWPTPIGSR